MAAEIWMDQQQPHEKLIEETLIVDDEATDYVIGPCDRDAPAGACLSDKPSPWCAAVDSFVQRTNVLKILTGSSLDYRHTSRQRCDIREG